MRTMLVGLLLGLATLAHASPADDAAAAASEGEAAFQRGDFPHALEAFERAVALDPTPIVHYHLGLTYERLDRPRDAAIAFQRYLQRAGIAVTDEERRVQAEVRARIADDQPPPPRELPAAALSPVLRRATARRRRLTGIIVTSVGVGLFLLGGGLILAAEASRPPVEGFVAGVYLGFGSFGMLAGGAMIIPGAVIWTRSQRIIDELDKPAAPGPQAHLFSTPPVSF